MPHSTTSKNRYKSCSSSNTSRCSKSSKRTAVAGTERSHSRSSSSGSSRTCNRHVAARRRQPQVDSCFCSCSRSCSVASQSAQRDSASEDSKSLHSQVASVQSFDNRSSRSIRTGSGKSDAASHDERDVDSMIRAGSCRSGSRSHSSRRTIEERKSLSETADSIEIHRSNLSRSSNSSPEPKPTQFLPLNIREGHIDPTKITDSIEMLRIKARR